MHPEDRLVRGRIVSFALSAEVNRARNRMARVFNLELYITLDAIPATLRNITDSELEAHQHLDDEDEDVNFHAEVYDVDYDDEDDDDDDDDDEDEDEDEDVESDEETLAVPGDNNSNNNENGTGYEESDTELLFARLAGAGAQSRNVETEEGEVSTIDIDDLSEALDQEFLRLEIEISEHLLLLLARQNTTNRNTLVEPPLPLRRSNAIRRRINPIPKRTIGASDVKKACIAMKLVVKSMQAGRFQNGPSPLFTSKLHKHSSYYKQPLHSENLEEALQNCAKYNDWSSKRRKIEELQHIQKPTYKTDNSITKDSNKRRRICDYSSSTPNLLESLTLKSLLSYQYCSNLRGGVQYTFDHFLLHILSVDYDTGTIQGFAYIDPSLKSLKKFIYYMLGSSGGIRARDGKLLRKIEVIESLMDSAVKSPSFHIPITGRMVDLSRPSDMFFLQKSKTPNMESILVKCKHHHSPISQTLIQLSEWIKVEPFEQFRDAFIFKEARNIYKELKASLKDGSLRNRRRFVEAAGGIHLAYKSSIKHNSLEKRNLEFEPQDSSGYSFRSNGFSVSNNSFNERLSIRLAEFVTCKNHCIANLNLNYSFFILDVDLEEMLDMMFEKLWKPGMSVLVLDFKRLTSTIQSPLRSASSETKATLLCLIDRKLGDICMHNTRSYLEFCNGYKAGNPQGYDAGEVFESVFQGIHLGEDDYTTTLYEGLGLQSRTGFKDPYLTGIETTLNGVIERNGHGIFGIV